jgi:hypothetical protein
MIREALEELAPEGSLPQQEFLADFREEAQVIVDALKRLVSRNFEVTGVAQRLAAAA